MLPFPLQASLYASPSLPHPIYHLLMIPFPKLPHASPHFPLHYITFPSIPKLLHPSPHLPFPYITVLSFLSLPFLPPSLISPPEYPPSLPSRLPAILTPKHRLKQQAQTSEKGHQTGQGRTREDRSETCPE